MTQSLYVAVVVVAIASPGAAQTTLEEVLEGCRKALANEAGQLGAAALFRGKGTIWGEPAAVELLARPPDRFALEIRGKFAIEYVVHESGGWEIDPMGAPWRLDLELLEKRRWLFSGMSGNWLDPALGVRCELGAAEAEDSAVHRLRLRRPGGALGATIELDRGSLLPRKLTLEAPAGPTVFEYANWSGGPSRRWPWRTTVRESSGSEIVLEFESVESPPETATDPFAWPDWSCADTHFSSEKPARVECAQSPLGFVLLKPKIDGQEVGWFVLDSGAAGWSLDRSVVERLELERFGRRGLVTLDRTSFIQSARATTFELGPVRIADPMFIVLDLAHMEEPLGFRPAGYIGADLLRRVVLELDLAGPSAEIHDPERFELKDGPWTPVRFDGRFAAVEAELEGERRGLFVLDTAMQMSVLFNSPFVAATKLFEGRETTPFLFRGVGSDHLGRTGHIAWFALAGRRFENLAVQFSNAATGALADQATAGVVGNQILRSARLVFDYPHARVAFLWK